MITYGCSLELLANMDYDKFLSLTKEQREDWEQLKTYVGKYTKMCERCIEMLEELCWQAKRMSKGYTKSKIEIFVNKWCEVYGIKTKGIYKKFDLLIWRVKWSLPVCNFNWTNYSNIESLEKELYSFFWK